MNEHGIGKWRTHEGQQLMEDEYHSARYTKLVNHVKSFSAYKSRDHGDDAVVAALITVLAVITEDEKVDVPSAYYRCLEFFKEQKAVTNKPKLRVINGGKA